ncbi:glucosidase, partial [Promineifilum sp.]|uniref:MGH1-like glycoside hydrolase domain-containing protein n=1 Tax=Promineifilum sp. TaxID=2664178 RepID=UPI0035ADB406
DPILKERLFGLSNSEGNHGEDVKEYYFYLDSTPTHSYMKYLYKYPQAAFPYNEIIKANRQRTRADFEFELLDTGVFDENRYFDIFVEYAKAGPEDILIQISAVNRGPDAAPLHILPTAWFRNTWWTTPGAEKPRLETVQGPNGGPVIALRHPELGDRYLYTQGALELLFTENETNNQRILNCPNDTRYVKDGVNNYLVNGEKQAVSWEATGTKATAHYHMQIEPGETAVVRLRLTDVAPDQLGDAGQHPLESEFEEIFAARRTEADEFYDAMIPNSLSDDERSVVRQALAGMLWSKQFYYYDLRRWLEEHSGDSDSDLARQLRNSDWHHMLNAEIISMPDKWEYPWYAAWDLAFHTVALNMVDAAFAQDQLQLMLRELYMHPNGQLPAYEWNFSDVNPPVHAWATLYNYNVSELLNGRSEIAFLKSAFLKLLMNFNWWVNRKDPSGRNVFEGGFLGLDNIGVFDRSSELPTGGMLEQADGTAWMAFFCQNMFSIAIELSNHDPVYEDMALKFLEHFFYIASAMDRIGDKHDEMWDEHDGFYYDVLRLPDGRATRLKVRSLVGLLPLCAATVISSETVTRFPQLARRVARRLSRTPALAATIHDPTRPGANGRILFSVLDEHKLRRVLACMLDEEEFLSPYGIRSLSRFHLEHPYTFNVNGHEFRVQYLPAESDSGMFGGNSNWRGPIWFPINILIIRSLLQYYSYYGDDFRIECPTGSGNQMTLFEVTQEIARRLASIFLRDEDGRRPVFGGAEKFQQDAHWRDNILFYEYFHGDNGAGLGASHQTGWTGLIAVLLKLMETLTPDMVMAGETATALMDRDPEPA